MMDAEVKNGKTVHENYVKTSPECLLLKKKYVKGLVCNSLIIRLLLGLIAIGK